MTKKLAVEANKLTTQTDHLKVKISRLESAREPQAFSEGVREMLLKEVSARDEQLQTQGNLISSLSERIDSLETSRTEKEEATKRLDRRMEKNEKVRLSVEKKRAKKRRNGANRSKKRSPVASEVLPAEEETGNGKAQGCYYFV